MYLYYFVAAYRAYMKDITGAIAEYSFNHSFIIAELFGRYVALYRSREASAMDSAGSAAAQKTLCKRDGERQPLVVYIGI